MNAEQLVPEQRLISVEEAFTLTGFTKQQVAIWRRRLQEPEKYRAMLTELSRLGSSIGYS